MAILEEGAGGNLVAIAVLLVGALLVRRTAPDLPPDLRSLVASGLKLFAEAEFEVQDGLIAKLAETTVQELLQTVPDGTSDAGANATAKRIISRYEQNARRRSLRDGWHERDSRARYHHQMQKLKSAVAQASAKLPPARQTLFARLSASISEDW